ncbi:WD40/YVTN/BNR-like repeat-containing protein [Streptomyces acidicola]|uniref:WD40/YVTN/BNR-like repeat-containing protein n=1 Tax=Streptomyces acidicola TaxID=2596892 RepID=UPI00341C2685
MDPTDSSTVYVAEAPSSGGTSAFRTRDDGRSWTPIADALQTTDPYINPVCVAVNPDHPEILYLGTYGRGIYVSSNRGEPGSWSGSNAIGGNVRTLIVDPRTSSNPAMTVLYAATTNGVYRSPDGGVTWSQVLSGYIWSLAAWMPPIGTAHFYAGVGRSGVFYANDPVNSAAWTNLSAAGIGLPAYTPAAPPNPESFETVLVDFCPQNPTRAYAWHLRDGASLALYTTGDPTASWSSVPWNSPPSPAYGYYAMSFAVTPNSPGNGTSDILLFGNVGLQRSTDSGRTWTADGVWYHADQHAIAFAPAVPAAGTVPATYIGCDGGIAKSTKFADPAYAIQTPPTDFNELEPLGDSAAWQNLNHGKQSSAIYQFTSDRRFPAITYVGCQDTGIQAGSGALGWRGIADSDGSQVAMTPGANGVILWATLGAYGGWASFRIGRWEDHREPVPGMSFATLGGSVMVPHSPYTVALDDTCLVGALVRDTSTTLTAAVTASPTAQAVTPASMNNIIVGSVATIDDGMATEETVTVTATTATTFTAMFGKNHAAAATVVLNRSLLARIAQDGSAVQISQDFTPVGDVSFVATHPSDADVLYCATSTQRVFQTKSGAAAGPATVWTEVNSNRPSGLSIRGLLVNTAGEAFVVTQPVTVGSTTTPLFRVSGGSWEPLPTTGLLPIGSYGRAAADPVNPDVLYAAGDNKVMKATRTGTTWAFDDISSGLPGEWVYDLWVGNIGSAAVPKVLLRAAIPTRGVWEADVTPAAANPGIDLYLRDNTLDTGHLTPSPDGLPNPYKPSEWVTHYQCEDVKIDALQRHGTAGDPDFFQTDPEGNPIPSLNHVLFDQLRDNSYGLPQSDLAHVHVQVHNRSGLPADGVRVWAIYCNAGAGVPSLAASASLGNAFPFWNQFAPDGTITPALPADSPWTSVGPPRTLSGIDATHPQVASWNWTIPTLATGDLGHFCMVTFVHSAAAPVGESVRMIVDQIAPTNSHTGQKNLHIGPPLPPGPAPGGGGGRGGMREYAEFHNPTRQEQRTDLVLDLRSLPPEVDVSFLLTRLRTDRPLKDSLFGVASSRKAGPGDLPASPVLPVRWPPLPRPLQFGAWRRWLTEVPGMLRCTLHNVIARLLGRPTELCAPEGTTVVPLPLFDPVLYRAEPSSLVGVRGVRIPPLGKAAAYLTVRAAGHLPAGAEYRFEVQQHFEDRETPFYGGGTYVVRVGGEPQRPRPVFAPSHDPDTDTEERERIERDAERERLRVLPPWTHGPIEQARDLIPGREEGDEE